MLIIYNSYEKINSKNYKYEKFENRSYLREYLAQDL